MFKAYRLRRRRSDEGTIAVMAAIIIPVVLLVIALALASLVWGTTETETQRASDQAALQGAASALLVPTAGVQTAPLFPTLASVLPAGLSATPVVQNLTNCKTLGDVYTSVTPLLNQVTGLLSTLLHLPTTTALTQALSGLNPVLAQALQNPSTVGCQPITVVPNTPSPTRIATCAAASAAMAPDKATWANNFFGGTGGAVPDCDNNKRVTVDLSEEDNNLLDLGGTNVSVLGSGPTTVTQTFNQVQTALASLGVRLQTTLPNTLCPKVSVGIDQPVKGPLFNKISTPNGRSTAKRVIKNAVIVPVFNGVSLLSPTTPVLGQITTPPLNLNTDVLAPLQQNLLGVLDTVNAAINQRLAGLNINVSGLVGANVGQLDLLQCVRDTVGDLFNPPTSTGSTPTAQQVLNQVLKDASTDGDVVNIIQVGVQNCPGALSSLDIYSCVLPALTGVVGAATGLYNVPFLDVTPAIVNQVADGQFQAVPVAATQAKGGFRAVLVRGSNNDRYAP